MNPGSNRHGHWLGLLLIAGLVCAALPGDAAAQALPKISLQFEDAKEGGDAAVSLQIIFLLTILSLAPSILIMMTSFTRIVVVLSFLRTAIGTHGQMPPNQLIVGLALFLTFFVMAPVWERVNEDAIQPLIADEIPYKEALDKGMVPMREFMLKQTRQKGNRSGPWVMRPGERGSRWAYRDTAVSWGRSEGAGWW